MGGILLLGLFGISLLSTAALRQVTKNSLENLELTIRDNFDKYSKSQVVNVISMLEKIYSRYENGDMTLEEAAIVMCRILLVMVQTADVAAAKMSERSLEGKSNAVEIGKRAFQTKGDV